MRKFMKKASTVLLAGMLAVSGVMMTGCSSRGNSDQVVIYSNADDEAVAAMKKTLDDNGYEGQYVFQTFGTSELGGKLIAEGKNLEADMITMSTFYVESAQEQNKMFKDLDFDRNLQDESKFEKYESPITAQEGTLILNTEVMKENNLPTPKSIKDLADPVYEGFISVTDIKSSSTAWLLIQGLVSEYGEDEAESILADIYKNAGDHIEDSGSGPIKNVRAGEVAIGFGLRQQAVADKKDGLPIDYVDPTEGNFTLTESVAVLDKEDSEKSDLAMDMAECIITKGRSELIKDYPVPLYNGETEDEDQKSGNPKEYKEKLTLDLLEKHQELSERAMEKATGK
nr:extracellular solute-binding protein [uncultured Anaerostipes sp.]